MIGATIGAASGLASGVLGAINSAKAAKKQQKLIDNQKAKNEGWYNRNYYQNYMDSAEAQSVMNRVSDTLRRKNEENRADAVISGATPEAALAQSESDNKVLADTGSALAAQSTAIKRNVDAQNNQNENNLMQQQLGQYQANESGGSSLMNNGFSLIGSALSLMDNNKKK